MLCYSATEFIQAFFLVLLKRTQTTRNSCFQMPKIFPTLRHPENIDYREGGIVISVTVF